MHPATLPFLAHVLRSQWRNREDIEREQRARLKRLLRHAYAHVPYYRNLLDNASITPDDIQTAGDLKQIPITTKSGLQAAEADAISSRVDSGRCITRRTTGTTGSPFSFLITRREKEAADMMQARAFFANGMKLTDGRAVFVAPNEIPAQPQWFQRAGFWRKHYFSVFDDVDNHVPALERLAPEAIAATPAVLARIAQGTISRGAEMRPRTVFSAGDLLDGGTRTLVEQAFGVAPVDLYGSLEFGYLAWECPLRNGYHMNLESTVIEVLDVDESSGEAGEVICTNLLSYAMPLIRFRLGDFCTLAPDPCPCGRGLPLLQLVEGRTNDTLRLPDGRRIVPQALAEHMVSFGHRLNQFRIVQDAHDHVEVLIVPRSGLESPSSMVVAGLAEILGERVAIDVHQVDQIPGDPTGKQRWVISNVGRNTRLEHD